MKTITTKTPSKYISSLILLALMSLSACNVKELIGHGDTTGGDSSPELPALPPEDKESSGESGSNDQARNGEPVEDVISDDPLSNTPVAPASFCVSEELRDVYATPIPHAASALYVALVHEGISGRKANPMCLADRAVVHSDGKTYIPCAVNAAEGYLYGRIWQDADRVWVKGALEREADLQNLKADGSVSVELETIGGASKFHVFPTLQGKFAAVLVLKAGITFAGYCQ